MVVAGSGSDVLQVDQDGSSKEFVLKYLATEILVQALGAQFLPDAGKNILKEDKMDTTMILANVKS